MASRIMHYAIATSIAEIIEIKDRDKFILGNLEPDLCGKEDTAYMHAHFGEENNQKGTKGINWVTFAKAYQRSILEDDEVLGYFVHLITDACWIKNIRDKHIRKYSKEQKQVLTAKGYRDMYKYNSLFIKKYELDNCIHEINQLAVKEADIQYKEMLINGLISDFQQAEVSDEPFEVYPYEEVMAFIALSIQKSIEAITALRMQMPLNDPEAFYVVK
ncbi:MAG: hypothetical protein RR090_08875 [Niameybacter sp.]|uniref:hypothetical protein n=1 Tax=Niameybacter sp. TaxID=2033640 RepID=UPI002FCB88A7